MPQRNDEKTPAAAGRDTPLLRLAREAARRLGHHSFAVIRKSVKRCMVEPLTKPVTGITSAGRQVLVLDGRNTARVAARRVCLVEDVVAAGGSVRAAVALLQKAGTAATVIAAVLLKGTFEDPRFVYLERPAM